MGKRVLLWLSILLLNAVHLYPQHKVSGRVVDSQTGDPIPYATLYVSEDKGALTNEDGFFSLDVLSGDSIRVSCIGYQMQVLAADNVPDVIRLSQRESVLREITVVPVKNLLESVVIKLDRDFIKKNRTRSSFFLRQAISYAKREEIMEAFIYAYGSVCLRNIRVLDGHRFMRTRWSQAESSLIASNLQHLMEMGPRVCEIPFWNDVTFPLGIMRRNYYWATDGNQKYAIEDDFPLCLNRYKMYVKSTTNDDGREIYEIHLDDRGNRSNACVVSGVLYVDAKDYSLLQFDGKARDLQMNMNKDFWTVTSTANIEIHSRYTHRHGFTEVEYVSCNMEAAGMKCRSIVYNLGTHKIKSSRGGKGVKLGDNLLDAIDRAGYDSTLWQQTYIQRTAEEERIVRESTGEGGSTQMEIAKEDISPRHKADSLTGAGGFRPLVERLRAFGRTIPQEKVYVHMDNTCYQLGDTIWFSAYTRRTDTGRPSNVSGVLYVELYGQDGYLVERKLIQMHNGHGNGFFALDKTTQYAGLHELRAYTRWQLNWGIYERKHSPYAFKWFESKELERAYFTDYEKLYSRVFPIYDKPQEPEDFGRNSTLRGLRRYFRKNKDKRTLTLRLFPEGGGLVQGLPGRVAFEAAWDDGEWVEGWLHFGKDSVKTLNRGRGVFTVTPTGEEKEMEVRFVATDGTLAKSRLPQADTLGTALRMEQEGGKWTACIRNSSNLPAGRLALTLMHEGRLKAFCSVEEMEREGETWRYAIADSLLRSPGVYQATVFDSNGRVYADRLFFARTGDGEAPSITIRELKDRYAPYEPVSLHVKATAGEASVSLAVRDDSRRDFLHDDGNIMTEMLLASEIRGFVPNPGWYFEQDDRERAEGLDLLMMTQGWRRFRWQDMAIRGTWELSQPAEQAPVLRGGVYKYNHSLAINMFNFNEQALRPSMSELFRNGRQSQPAEPAILGGYSNRQQETVRTIKTEEDRHGEQERKTRGKDREYILSHQYLKADKDVKIHSELVSEDGEEISINERKTNDGRFQIQLPPFYGKAVFFLSAADTTKWSRRKRRRYTWIQGKEYEKEDLRAPLNRFKKARFDVPVADYMPRIQWPYPRFVSPYNHYQATMADRPKKENGWGISEMDADSVRHMGEVSVRARHNGLRKFDDSQPCLIIDAEESDNLVFDAGMFSLARYMVADYGMEYPFVSNPEWSAENPGEPDGNLDTRFGISPMRRSLPPYRDTFANVPEDSLYARKYLCSFPEILSKEEQREFMKGMDKALLYTDYNRRMPGNWRYRATDLPVTTTVYYPHTGIEPRMQYRDRHYVLQGFAHPAEFYSPDYSQGKLPDAPTDYRRTLYWNPQVVLDRNGEATVTFYNCARATEPGADAQGQARDGTPLWSK